VQCPNCNHWNEGNANFCEECGFELKTTSTTVKQFKGTGLLGPEPPKPPPLPPAMLPSQAHVESANSEQKIILIATGSIFRLGEKTSVGREDPRLDIDLEGYPEGKFVSGNHAQIVKMGDQYYVEDLGSSNHTFVNNRRIAAGQLEPLKDEDVIRFGKIELRFYES
jgi:pSer/pThr/pTyr-binding forkhead associated (FHA) protein